MATTLLLIFVIAATFGGMLVYGDVKNELKIKQL